MPIFENVTITADVEFEVFCQCGNHLCNATSTRLSARRGTPQAVVEACEDCLERAREPYNDLKQQYDELEDTCVGLENLVIDLKRQIEELKQT